MKHFKAIKLGFILALALFGGAFFIVGSALAVIDENFESYDTGKINYQINPPVEWKDLNNAPQYHEYSLIVNTERASDGVQSIMSHPTSTDLEGSSEMWWATSTGTGIISIDFQIDKRPVWARIEFNQGFQWGSTLEIGTCCAEVPYNTENWDGVRWQGIDLTDDVVPDVWHRVSIQYNLSQNWGRASYDFGEWSATTTLKSSPPFTGLYWNRYIFRTGGKELERIWFDNFSEVGDCNSTCLYCDYSGCQDYEGACDWNFNENQCQPLIFQIPDIQLPTEDCSVLGITDRLLCELKNFFYRLFVPTPEKIQELQTTIGSVKEKFPYNYILEFKDFFIYIRDNVDDEQPVNFSILGQAGSLNFSFWQTTTTIAGSEQSIKDIIQKVFGFLILLGFGFWAFGFIKRIFK